VNTFKGHLATLLGIGGFALAFLIVLLTWSNAAPWSGGDYKVRVLFPTAASMGPGASVRIAGIQVGKVTSVERKGAAAVLTMKIGKGKTPLPEDTRAAIRLRTLVGENYVELIPGKSKQTLASGGILPVSQTENYVEADEILSVLRGQTRERARELIQGFGGGLDGQGVKLNGMLKDVTGVVRAGDDLTAILSKDRQQVAGLVDQVGHVMQEIGDRTTSIKTLASSGRDTFQALANRDEGLKATLRQLPPTLKQVQTTSGLVKSVTARSAPVVAKLASAVGGLDPVFASLKPAAEEGRGIMRSLSTAAPRLTTTAGKLQGLGAPTAAAMPQLNKLLCQVNPMAKYLAPFAGDVSAMLANMSSSTNYYDATGHAARFYALVGQNSFTAIPDVGKDLLNKVQDIGLVNQLTARGYNPYPAAGDSGIPKGGEGDSGPMDSDLPYPHVEAEC
jgi:phospholipid/cholesterol/gamma-HCH transport system substrate-binding protein